MNILQVTLEEDSFGARRLFFDRLECLCIPGELRFLWMGVCSHWYLFEVYVRGYFLAGGCLLSYVRPSSM